MKIEIILCNLSSHHRLRLHFNNKTKTKNKIKILKNQKMHILIKTEKYPMITWSGKTDRQTDRQTGRKKEPKKARKEGRKEGRN